MRSAAGSLIPAVAFSDRLPAVRCAFTILIRFQYAIDRRHARCILAQFDAWPRADRKVARLALPLRASGRRSPVRACSRPAISARATSLFRVAQQGARGGGHRRDGPGRGPRARHRAFECPQRCQSGKAECGNDCLHQGAGGRGSEHRACQTFRRCGEFAAGPGLCPPTRPLRDHARVCRQCGCCGA